MSEGVSLRSGGGGFAASGGEGESELAAVTSAPPSPLSEASPPKAKPSPPRKKGPRPKHVPQRMCIACRSHDAKRGLHRIVRTPEGQVEPDPTGRRNGRGAYLCGQAACWEKALASGMLARALNVDIDIETMHALRRHAATLPLDSSEAAGATRDRIEGGNR